ncbi:aminoglycoside phosphotransferase family protein, partial [Escherichia coli]|uniref:aminoglycoside phosphotransferase family protein n=1 Tax=Escherichia coli TaxID=562 RepID=UPI00202BAE88
MFMPPVFPAHWHVSQPVLIADTFSSLVWKVSLPDGTPAIVKGLKPIEDIADELRGADYLVWRNGRGAVRLLGRENNLMLLEYAGERMLSHIVAEHGDYQATEIAAELMAKLYAASEEPLPSALLPIRDRFAALFQRARDDQNAGCQTDYVGTVAKLAMRQPFVLFKGLTFQKLCLPGAFRPGDHHNKMLRPG